jgi:hypothetical protein
MDTLYKILGENGASLTGEHETWSLPQDGQPGNWMRPIKGALADTNGYHLYRARDLLIWLGPTIYEAECRRDRLDTEKAVTVREARLVRRLESWNDESARVFAAACADHVLPIYERQRPEDDRPRRAIEAARLFALGFVTADELAAAWRAARDVMTADLLTVSGAALAAARAAAMSAAVGPGWSILSAAADAAHAAREAGAWDATHTLARDGWGATDLAARAMLHDSMAATWAAAEAKERAWQTERLLTYLGIGQVPAMDMHVVAEQVAMPLVRAAVS